MKKAFFFILILASTRVSAQFAVVASGGDAVSSSGSVSFSVGQISNAQVNSSTGSLSEGVQQPFELFEVTVNEVLSQIGISLFPNPALTEVIIELPTMQEGIKARIYSSNGSLIEEVSILSKSTSVNVRNWAASTYYVNLSDSSGNTSTYKLVKH
jgi:hypothetical protein